MALSKIQRGMIDNGAVQPQNLITTATYTVGALTASGAVTAATLAVSNMATVRSISITTSTAGRGLAMNNTDIVGVNALYFSDPGSQEGVNWYGGNWWKIFDSPDNLVSNTTGNLQFVSSGTRILTMGVNGRIEIPGNLQITGVTTATTLSSTNLSSTNLTATNLTVAGQINVGNASGLLLSTLRNSTSTTIAYYNSSTRELTYAPLSIAANPFDQSLNTTDNVRFANLTATNNLSIASTVTVTAGLGFRVSALRASNNANAVLYNASTGEMTYVPGPGQTFYTTSSPTLANLTLTNTLYVQTIASTGTITANTVNATTVAATNGNITTVTSANGNIDNISGTTATYTNVNGTNVRVNNAYTLPTNYGTTGSVLISQGNGSILWGISTSTNVFDQDLNTDDNVRFNGISVNTGTAFGVFKAGTIASYENPGVPGDYNSLLIQGRGAGANGTSIEMGTNGTITLNGITNGVADLKVLPENTDKVDLGSPAKKFRFGYFRSITVNKGTIFFEDTATNTTSSLSLSTGTIFVDGVPLVNQSMTPTSNVVFSSTTITNVLTINDYTLPPAISSTAGYAMVSAAGGQIQFQPAVMTGNVSIDGGFANSIYTAFDYAIDGGGASA